MATFDLSSSGRQHAIQAVPVDSILTCLSTSAPDVYVGGVTSGSPVHNLSAGDSMLALVGTVSVYLFRKSRTEGAFSAQLELSPSPTSPHPLAGDPDFSGTFAVAKKPRKGDTRPAKRGAKTGGPKD